MPISAERLKSELASEFGQWPRRDWALLDIREAGEAEAGHIPGATFLPRRQIEFRIRDLVPAVETRIVIYDGDDERAKLAARTLNGLGYRRVDCLDGGLPAWRAAGGEVAQGSNVPCKDFGEKVLVAGKIPYITATALKERIDRGDRVAICDVRTPDEHRSGCIPAGHSAPSFELALHADDLRRDNDLVVVNCAGRTRSIIGTSTLQLLGIDNVAALENGTMGWRLAGYELEKGATRVLSAASTASIASAAAAARDLAGKVGTVAAEVGAVASLAAERGRRNVYVFDVRPLGSYVAGHIPGAIALPGGQAVQRAGDFTAVPAAEIVFVDDDDARAFLTAYWYRRMGFPNVSVLSGGMPAWQAAGKAIERGRGRVDPAGVAAARARVRTIAPGELASTGAPDCVIDVGTSRQFAKAHLRGARWLPRGWLEARIAAIVGPTQPVLVSAADTAQAVFAAATLVDLGYRDVRALDGSVADAQAAGAAIEAGLPADCLEPGDVIEPPYAKGRESMLRYLEWETKLGHKYETSAAHS